MPKPQKKFVTPREKLLLHYKNLKKPKYKKDLSHLCLSPQDEKVIRRENQLGKIAYFQRRREAITDLKKQIRPPAVLMEDRKNFVVFLVRDGDVLKESDSPWVMLRYLDYNHELSIKTPAL